MSDDGNMWEAIHEEKKKKRLNNQIQSLKILEKEGIKVKRFSDWHYKVGDYDFWPTTGKFINRVTKEGGRGVFNLLKILKVE